MTKEEMKELLGLQQFVENTSDDSKYLYTEYLERGNLRIARGNKSKSDRLNITLPDNPEFNELHWWILYAVSVLRMADSEAIYRYLCAEKRKHPELLYSVEDKRIIKRWTSNLAKWGFLIRTCYVAHTDIDVSEAEERLFAERSLAQKKKLDIAMSANAISLDDEYMDDESEKESDDIEFVDYDKKGYSSQLAANLKSYHGRRFGSETFVSSVPISYYYGKNASLVTMYTIEEEAYYWLKQRFGNCVPAYRCETVALPHMQLGAAAAGYITSALCLLPSYTRVLTGFVNSKFNGAFVVPHELEFKKKLKNGNIFTYTCAVFIDYYFPGRGKLLPHQTEQNLMDEFFQIKNYIGIHSYKEGKSSSKDCFVIVVVNDMLDISKFLFKLLKFNVSDAEICRIYFTGEGIVNSDYGIGHVLGFRRDPEKEEGYSLFPALLPVL